MKQFAFSILIIFAFGWAIIFNNLEYEEPVNTDTNPRVYTISIDTALYPDFLEIVECYQNNTTRCVLVKNAKELNKKFGK